MELGSLAWRTKLGVVAALAVLLAVLAVGTAIAATPQDIYNDYAADGDLDGDYTAEELAAVLSDPLLAQYADPTVLDNLKKLLQSSGTDRSVFPFTGAQMLSIFGGGLVLLLLGVFLRRGRRDEGSS